VLFTILVQNHLQQLNGNNMFLIKRILTVCLLMLFVTVSIHAQNAEKTFKEGKALFDQKDYALALVKFAPLTSLNDESELVTYASYYYAVSAYHSGDSKTARNMFMQLNQKSPNWSEKSEVNYWLAQLSFESNDFKNGMQYLDKIGSDSYSEDKENLKYYHFSQVKGIEELKMLLNQYPEEVILANNLLNEILKLDVIDQDIDMINDLSAEYEISVNVGFDGIESSPKKEVYNISLFLPFRYSEDSLALEQIQGIWPMRLYEGAQLGVEKLLAEGIKVNLQTFDTKGNETVTKDILNQPEISEMDLMIGPVFRGPVQEVSGFSKANKVNMVNPLSSTSDVIENNPFAFLYYPSNESLALKAAEYAKLNFTENKNAAIFYSGPADKLRADYYKTLIEQDSFQVVIFERVTSANSVFIQQLLTEEEELDKDSLTVETMIAEMDSLREAEVEDWEIYRERDFLYDTLKILPDSIGHIFVASDDRALSASAISGIASRMDSINFIGSSRWLSAEQSISFELLENIDATFTGSNLIRYESDAIADFRTRYEERFKTYPKKGVRFGDAYTGYDILVTYGRLLHEYGKYFQVGLKRKSKVAGELTEAFDYRLTNDNRYIPILKIRNSQISEIKD